MNKKIAVASILAICLATSSFLGCSKKGESEGSSEPIVETVDRVEFSFTSSLGEKELPYPISTGKTYYVSASGNDNNDGLSEATPLKTVKK